MRVGVEAYGCTMSMGEGECFRRQLCSLGHQLVDSEEADLVVINTCAVIQFTENRMIGRIKALSTSGKRLVVAGCLAVTGPDRVLAADPRAILLPFQQYPQFQMVVEDQLGRGDRPVRRPPGIVEVVPIAQGCMGSCTYCLTRLARGRLVSRPAHEIEQEVRGAAGEGTREIQVTAQDTACYGADLGTDLASLLGSLSSIPGGFRIRVGMMNPESLMGIMHRYLEVWRSPRLFQFLHLPVQSGSDEVLGRMGRRYTVQDFLALVQTMREVQPEMTLSTDLIVGFPGETAEDHELNLRLIERVRPDIVNITRFSPRPGTPAQSMPGTVHGRVAKQRSRELTSLRFSISLHRNMSMVGRVEEVILTERGKDGTVVGRTASYRPVVVEGGIPLGTVIEVEVVDAAPTHLFGRIHSLR